VGKTKFYHFAPLENQTLSATPDPAPALVKT